MFLRRLTLFNFKNYDEAEFSFSEGANAFTGQNGSGKTNILDAIHYLCLCKSYFNSGDALSIKHLQSFFSINGTFELDGKNEEILVLVKNGQKKSIKRNQKEYSRLGEHIGLLPLVMEAPVDQELISGGSEERRKLMDSIICQYNHPYLDDLMAYNRVLQQRNALLKQTAKGALTDASLWQVWDEQLAVYGEKIYLVRKDFMEHFLPLFQESYAYLTNNSEEAGLKYNCSLEHENLQSQLNKNLQKDLILQYTTAGIHKDDLTLTLNGHPAKRIGSQGQQKSIILALKLAQFKVIKETRGLKPILMLDDIFDKLDLNRITRLMELVSKETFGQLFITDTEEDHVRKV
nr:DNA replication/repair protein RecF [Ignavibacteriaceae bacterium]